MPFTKGQSGNPAGRPRRAEKYAGQIAASEDWIADRLPQLLAAQYELAIGGFEQIEETYAPAGTITIGSGESLVRVFPGLPADEPVLVKRTRSIAAPDRGAGQYLIDRILGKSTAEIDAKIDAPDGGALARFLESVTKIYGGDA